MEKVDGHLSDYNEVVKLEREKKILNYASVIGALVFVAGSIGTAIGIIEQNIILIDVSAPTAFAGFVTAVEASGAYVKRINAPVR